LTIIQRGIKYTPNHEYFAFDILVKTAKGALWVKVTELDHFLNKHIPTVPIHKKGSLDEILQVNIEIDSTIPELLGLPKLDKNLIEGMVLRPDDTQYLGFNRAILKKKNAQFMEKNTVE
jgi:hypothetical protein